MLITCSTVFPTLEHKTVFVVSLTSEPLIVSLPDTHLLNAIVPDAPAVWVARKNLVFVFDQENKNVYVTLGVTCHVVCFSVYYHCYQLISHDCTVFRPGLCWRSHTHTHLETVNNTKCLLRIDTFHWLLAPQLTLFFVHLSDFLFEVMNVLYFLICWDNLFYATCWEYKWGVTWW